MNPEEQFITRKPDYSGMCVQELVFGEIKGHYGETRSYALDLITPPEAEALLPVVIFVHGGGFSVPCDKRQSYISKFAKRITRRGWAVVSPDYPVYATQEEGEQNYDAGAVKAAEAIQLAYEYLVANASRLSLDMSRVAIMGGSAGGMAGFHAVSQHPGQYKAFINLWGVPDELPDLSQFPPTLSVHGTEDKLVPYSLEAAAQRELKKHGIKHDLVTLEGYGHTPIAAMDRYMPQVFRYLEEE